MYLQPLVTLTSDLTPKFDRFMLLYGGPFFLQICSEIGLFVCKTWCSQNWQRTDRRTNGQTGRKHYASIQPA